MARRSAKRVWRSLAPAFASAFASAFAFAFAFAFASGFAFASDSAEVLSLDEYRDRLQEAVAFLERGMGDLDPAESAWLKGRFPQDLRVRDVEGGEVQVSPDSLFGKDGEAMRGDSARASLRARLHALVGHLSVPPQTSLERRDWGRSRETLHELYQSRAFRHLIEERSNPWMEILLEQLRALTRWLKGHLSDLPRIGRDWVEVLVYGLIISLAILLIWWVARAFGALGWRRDSPRLEQAGTPGGWDQGRQRDWISWREEARTNALQGAFREAIRCLFISVLLEGHERGWWVHEAQATNREHLARLAETPERRRAFQGLLGHYERAWYGLRELREEEFRACEAWVLRMEEAP
jgi:hypothetical protein